MTPKTRYSITSQQGLDRELQRIRETGIATTRESTTSDRCRWR
ncbi:hypothetical protein GS416_01645 [Rhodococcus hoagii]|nr:hypothetical protein [Prescottella equi]